MGVILYEFLVGCVPFFGDTPEELFGQVISGRYHHPGEAESGSTNTIYACTYEAYAFFSEFTCVMVDLPPRRVCVCTRTGTFSVTWGMVCLCSSVPHMHMGVPVLSVCVSCEWESAR